jgi:hypothetical protein
MNISEGRQVGLQLVNFPGKMSKITFRNLSAKVFAPLNILKDYWEICPSFGTTKREISE